MRKMYKLAVVVLLCSQAFARPSEYNGIESHIVGGTPATEGQYPFIVSLRKDLNFTFCGGALISDRWIATAAHCVVNNETVITIGAGSIHLSQQKLHHVEKVVIHPGYKLTKTENDIALIKLKAPIKLDEKTQIINYPTKDNLDGKNVTALGWGYTSDKGPGSSVLLTLKRPTLSNKDCVKAMFFPIADSQLCLGSIKGYGMCFGDSGSPLLYKGTDGKNYIAGVVSWGIPCAKGFPDVFTRISSFTSWIKENAV